MTEGEPVVLVPYSTEWPEHFDAERRSLVAAFDPVAVQVEHIGSTAVPGLAAKPIVDILLGAASLEAIERRIDRLAGIGYGYVPDYEDELPERRYFVKLRDGTGFHLHAVEASGRFWIEHLAFRDILRGDARVAAEYESLKRGLAARFARDRGAYTEAKSSFIRNVLCSR